MYLEEQDRKEIKEISLFADGCPGQNKNSIVATMLLHTVCNSSNIEQISLYFFEAYHGQNEGDSAHSCINTAIEATGDVYVPTQLVPIFRLARKHNPYIVHSLKTVDILDYKIVAHQLRILSIRKDDNGDPIDWTTMRQIVVKKSHGDKIFFADSHLKEGNRSLTLKRGLTNASLKGTSVPTLYQIPPKVSKEKFCDLMSLCQGQTPAVSMPEHVAFYKSLPHEK